MNIEQTRLLQRRADSHAALADVTRLQIVDRLAVSDASSSELGASLGIPSNLLAHHLNVLARAGLVTRRRSEGDGRRTYLSLTPRDALALPGTVLESPQRMLFVCTANTARSHLAAALWRSASSVDAASAGTHPGSRIHPGALAAAARHGLDMPELAPTALNDIARDGDLIVTVCDRAHEAIGPAGWAHWSVPDPVPDGTDQAFDAAFEDLAARVGALVPKLAKAS
jgi:ArsR family transcriptional regulator, arsenate/arsenite/antimonite-responsive transcriptional repressor / arsenate reductase (thioredoxin)